MARDAGRRWWWGLAVAAWVGVASLALGPDPGWRVTQAESFAVRAVDVSGRRHPIATFDGRIWLVDLPRGLVGPPAPDPPAIVGLETSDGVPVSTVRVFAASGERWRWAQQAVEAAGAAHGRHRRTSASPRCRCTCPPACAGGAVYVDLTVRTTGPRWQGAVVGAWVLPQDGAAPVVLGARAGGVPQLRRVPADPAPPSARHRRGRTWRHADLGDVQPQRGRRHVRAGRRQPARAARAPADSARRVVARLATGRSTARCRRSASNCRESRAAARRCRRRAPAG